MIGLLSLRIPAILVLLQTLSFISNISSTLAQASLEDESQNTVNCGSTVKLYHAENPSYFLNSASFSWGTGSKQQVVTLKDGKDESHASSLWLIQEAHGKKACETGTPIRCGDTVRFFHITTKKRLHSHEFPSSLTPNQQEVSAFRIDPSATTVTEDYDMEGGDKSDDWTILCSTPYWTIGQNVRLYHVATRAHLESSSSRKFTSQNCPRCPIVGELEVSTSKRATSRKNFFRADEQGAHVFKL